MISHILIFSPLGGNTAGHEEPAALKISKTHTPLNVTGDPRPTDIL